MARRSDERDAARAEYIARMEKDGEVNLRQLADDLHLKYLFYIERVQFLRQNHIRSESISIMFYCGSHFS